MEAYGVAVGSTVGGMGQVFFAHRMVGYLQDGKLHCFLPILAFNIVRERWVRGKLKDSSKDSVAMTMRDGSSFSGSLTSGQRRLVTSDE